MNIEISTGMSVRDLGVELVSALDAATNRHETTWITLDGKRVAIVAPADAVN